MSTYYGKKNFILLSLGQLLAVIGDKVSTALFISLAVIIIGRPDTSFNSNIIVAFQFLPFLLFGYFFGLMADDFEKRKILIFTNIVRALLFLVLFLLPKNLFFLYLIVFFIGVFTSMFEPAKKSILPFLVPKGRLVFFNKIFAILEIMAMIVGLGIGIVLEKHLGINKAIIINASFYLVSMLILLFIKYEDNSIKVERKLKKLNFKQKIELQIRELKEGLIYLNKNDNVKFVIINIVFIHFLAASILFSTLTDFGIRTSELVHKTAGGNTSLIMLFVAIGALFSPLVKKFLNKYSESELTIRIYRSGAFLFLMTFVIVSFGNNFYHILKIMFFLIGILAGLQYIRFLYLIQMNCDKKYLGRVVSISEFVWCSVIVLGVLIGSIVNEFFTYKYAFLLLAFVYIVGAYSFKFSSGKISW